MLVLRTFKGTETKIAWGSVSELSLLVFSTSRRQQETVGMGGCGCGSLVEGEDLLVTFCKLCHCITNNNVNRTRRDRYSDAEVFQN